MEKLLGRNWRTTMLGILGILGLVSTVGTGLLEGKPIEWSSAFTQLMLSIGLLRAGDAKNVTP